MKRRNPIKRTELLKKMRMRIKAHHRKQPEVVKEETEEEYLSIEESKMSPNLAASIQDVEPPRRVPTSNLLVRARNGARERDLASRMAKINKRRMRNPILTKALKVKDIPKPKPSTSTTSPLRDLQRRKKNINTEDMAFHNILGRSNLESRRRRVRGRVIRKESDLVSMEPVVAVNKRQNMTAVEGEMNAQENVPQTTDNDTETKSETKTIAKVSSENLEDDSNAIHGSKKDNKPNSEVAEDNTEVMMAEDAPQVLDSQRGVGAEQGGGSYDDVQTQSVAATTLTTSTSSRSSSSSSSSESVETLVTTLEPVETTKVVEKEIEGEDVEEMKEEMGVNEEEGAFQEEVSATTTEMTTTEAGASDHTWTTNPPARPRSTIPTYTVFMPHHITATHMLVL